MRPRIRTLSALAVLATAGLAAPAAASAADESSPAKPAELAQAVDDIQLVPEVKFLQFRDQVGRSISRRQLESKLQASAGSAQRAAQAAGGDTPVGTQRLWVGIDFVSGAAYLKNFVLRRVGEHMEIWTAVGTQRSPGSPTSTDLQFLPGDCRNGVRTQVTDAQLDRLVQQFDNKILPVESKVFSVAPNRDGSKPQIPGADFSGGGGHVVTLVDNVRDTNFYDKNNTKAYTFIGGFFSRGINQLVDRNVMTIDGFDWLHRTGDNPPDNPSTDLCTNAPARPNLYEGTFAHEYQHLLESYQDPEEVNWVNEGLSDYAETVTGYANPSRPITAPRFDSHIQCFLGYLRVKTPFNTIPRKDCGPSNSLTLWGDQGDDNILADYGAAYSMMEFLAGRYGVPFMNALHRESAEGLAGLQKVLNRFAPGTTTNQVLHDWAAMIVLDNELDSARVSPRLKRFTTPTLHSSVLWDNPEAYQSGTAAPGRAGAPANGSDYVRLRDAGGKFLSAGQLKTLSFSGAKSISRAVEWSVDPAPTGHASAALHSGTGNALDRSIARQVTVPTSNSTLTFDTLWSTEPGFDSGFVQVSTDGGKSWKSLANADTTDKLGPIADPTLLNNRPGFNGESGGWKTESFDLSPYAGQRVLLGFRYFSDANTNGRGWRIDNVSLGGTSISDGSTVAGWRTYSQLQPLAVHGFTVQLISYTPGRDNVRIDSLNLDPNFAQTLNTGQLRHMLGREASVVAAIVMYDEPTERIDLYAPYNLKVNGVTQPGGS